MTRASVSLYAIGLLSMFIAACTTSIGGQERFTQGTLDAAVKAQAIRDRTTGIHTLTAVLTVEFSNVDRHGTFEMIVNYDDAGHLRFSADRKSVV